MTEDAKRIFELAMSLSPAERTDIAARLVESVHAFAKAEAAWAQIVRERAARASVGRDDGRSRGAFQSTTCMDIDAEVDMERAVSWYETEAPDRVEPFLGGVSDAIRRITRTPDRFGAYAGVDPSLGVRRTFVIDFPYTVAFVHHDRDVRVLAIASNFRPPLDPEISVSALITVESWLQSNGVRALSVFTIGLTH